MSGEECESGMDYSEDECGYADYYNDEDDCEMEQPDPTKRDPEYFSYECLSVEEVERHLNVSVEALSNSLQITPSLAKVLLHTNRWSVQDIVKKFGDESLNLLDCKSSTSSTTGAGDQGQIRTTVQAIQCPVCLLTQPNDKFSGLSCGHKFCKDCWSVHFEVQILQGVSTGIGCMAKDCDVLAPEDFVLSQVSRPATRERRPRPCPQVPAVRVPRLRQVAPRVPVLPGAELPGGGARQGAARQARAVLELLGGLLLPVRRRLPRAHGLRHDPPLAHQVRRRQRDGQLHQRPHQGLPALPRLHREERRLQPHAVLQLQARLLLDVPRGLEVARLRLLRVLALQGEPGRGAGVGADARPRGAQEVPALLRALGEPLEEPQAGGADAAQDPAPHRRQDNELGGHVDRLAVPAGRGGAAGQVPLHAAVHVPVRLLHGGGPAQGALRVPAGAARGRDREPLLEGGARRDDGPRRPREPDGHRREAAHHPAQGLPVRRRRARGVIMRHSGLSSCGLRERRFSRRNTAHLPSLAE